MFDSMVYNLTADNTDNYISCEEYEIFCREFIFDKLRGMGFGKAFCNRFNIVNYIIPQLSDESAKDYIEKQGFVV
jgi:hypothetical protein